MTRRQGYRCRLKPTLDDAALLRQFISCSRFVWNGALAMNELRHERGEKRLGYSAMCEYPVYLKGEYSFLREVHKCGFIFHSFAAFDCFAQGKDWRLALS